MLASTICDKCGHLMKDDTILRGEIKECTQHYCSNCGYNYESGLRYNILTKQYIKYLRFNP